MTFTGSADTPHVMTVFVPVLGEKPEAEVRYCTTPAEVLATVREYGYDPSADQIVALLSCSNGDSITLGVHEFSIEREF